MVLINAFMRALVLQMEARGVKNPLHQEVKIAELWRDLCILYGAPIPADVAAATKEQPS